MLAKKSNCVEQQYESSLIGRNETENNVNRGRALEKATREALSRLSVGFTDSSRIYNWGKGKSVPDFILGNGYLIECKNWNNHHFVNHLKTFNEIYMRWTTFLDLKPILVISNPNWNNQEKTREKAWLLSMGWIVIELGYLVTYDNFSKAVSNIARELMLIFSGYVSLKTNTCPSSFIVHSRPLKNLLEREEEKVRTESEHVESSNLRDSEYSSGTLTTHESPYQRDSDAHIFSPYDLSSELREEHDNYMEEYRKYLMKICKYTKEIVFRYTELTVGNGYKLSPEKAYRIIQTEIEREQEPLPTATELIERRAVWEFRARYNIYRASPKVFEEMFPWEDEPHFPPELGSEILVCPRCHSRDLGLLKSGALIPMEFLSEEEQNIRRATKKMGYDKRYKGYYKCKTCENLLKKDELITYICLVSKGEWYYDLLNPKKMRKLERQGMKKEEELEETEEYESYEGEESS